ncbi:hypothetical protein VTO42DRAFT_5792 [Malbranchea cinnamomea]
MFRSSAPLAAKAGLQSTERGPTGSNGQSDVSRALCLSLSRSALALGSFARSFSANERLSRGLVSRRSSRFLERTSTRWPIGVPPPPISSESRPPAHSDQAVHARTASVLREAADSAIGSSSCTPAYYLSSRHAPDIANGRLLSFISIYLFFFFFFFFFLFFSGESSRAVETHPVLLSSLLPVPSSSSSSSYSRVVVYSSK